ncbi:O-methyltransferase [Actinoplanes sp. RD1]|uniref:O-methyltransferase n=1 Tax=Actinoplanes sp. RD1 TaxID=3064538 RepID=UPI002740F870|nr:class I SAM-dependent methyltransferase [Actinoplanes sp. RD1]
MSTLTTAPVKPLLATLFADARRTQERFRLQRADLLAQGHRPGSPEFAAATRQAHLAVTPETGQLLYLLTRTAKARTVVEFGTSFGVSTLHLAAALRDNGTGTLITTELEPTKAAATRATLAEAGLADLVEILEGDARQTLPQRRPRPIDLLFLDGANHLYVEVLRLLEPDLAPGALVVADNAGAPGYRDYLATQDRYVSVSVGERVEVTVVAD